MIAYNFRGKNGNMQTKAERSGVKRRKAGSPSLRRQPATCKARAKWLISHREIKDSETGIRNSRNTVVMASWVYTGVRNSEMIKLYNSTCVVFLYAK